MALKKHVLFLNGKKFYTKKLKAADQGATFHYTIENDFVPDGLPKALVTEFDIKVGEAPVPVNVPPVINVKSAMSVLVSTAVTIAATITDSDGSIASIDWKQISTDPIVPFSISVDRKSIAFTTLADPAVYIFEVTAVDDDGANTSKQVTVTAKTEPDPDPEPSGDLILAAAGDTEDGNEADQIFGKIAAEKVDKYLFLGDSSYDDNDATGWTALLDKNGLKEEIILTQGNHEHAESDAEACETDIENWMPSLKDTPEVDPSQPSWEKTKWISGQQVKNSYIISMNSQDMDRDFKRNQFNFVTKQLDIAKALKDENKIDWIIVLIHKPWYTLKTSHGPETAVRAIYQPLFESYQVDFVLHGHNHNIQSWLPLTTNAQQLFTRLPDGTFDFSKPHGQFFLISGAGGHEHNGFQEDPAGNPNIFFANDSDYGYTMLYITGKNATVQTKNINGTVIHTFKVTKGPQDPTQPVLNLNFPSTIEILKTGTIDASQSNADTVTVEQTTSHNINLAEAERWKWQFTPPDILTNTRAVSYSLGFKAEARKGNSLIQKSVQISVTRSGGGGSDEFDEFGTKMLYKPTGRKVDMEEGSDHENGKRYNVNHKFENYMMIGYFLTGSGQEKWEMKTDGPNHSGCDGGDECMWSEPQWNISDGSFNLGGEWPHPTNREIDKSKYTVAAATGSIDKQWIGTAVCAYWNSDGNRVTELWANKDPFLPDGKPNNANWFIGLKAIDSATNVILPSQQRPRKIPINFDRGLEAEIRMHRATSGDTKMKWCRVYEILPLT